MEHIQLTPQMDCHLNRRHAQTNYGHRKLHIDSINRENLVRVPACRAVHEPTASDLRVPRLQMMLKRLQRAKSVYNSAKWEEERKDMLRRIRYMSE